MTDKKLREMRDWAQAMSYSQREPRWTWQRYKDLVAMIDGILASQAATIVQENAKRADLRRATIGPGARTSFRWTKRGATLPPSRCASRCKDGVPKGPRVEPVRSAPA